MPTLQSDFVADVTIVLRGSRKLVVTFCLLRLRALPCYDLHRSTSLLSFADVTVGLLFYLILEWLVCRRYDRASSLGVSV